LSVGLRFLKLQISSSLKRKQCQKSKGIDTERKNSKKFKNNTKTDSFLPFLPHFEIFGATVFS
jgi:hypothetical protein